MKNKNRPFYYLVFGFPSRILAHIVTNNNQQIRGIPTLLSQNLTNDGNASITEWVSKITLFKAKYLNFLRQKLFHLHFRMSGDKLGLVVAEFCFKFNHPEIAKNLRSFLEYSLRLVTTG